MGRSDGFNYDLNEARLHGNIFEKIFHNRRLQFWLSRIDYKNKKILDIGCNTGILLIPFAKRGADVRKIPNLDNYFEIVILSDVLEHVSSPEMAVKEAVRVTKPKGKI